MVDMGQEREKFQKRKRPGQLCGRREGGPSQNGVELSNYTEYSYVVPKAQPCAK